jgi:hypothetical protein
MKPECDAHHPGKSTSSCREDHRGCDGTGTAPAMELLRRRRTEGHAFCYDSHRFPKRHEDWKNESIVEIPEMIDGA